MTQVSRYPLRKEIEHRMGEVFLDSIGMVTSRKQVENFIEDLLSPTEKVMLAKRLSIALLLLKQYDHRTISKILRVGLETINKVNRSLQKGKGGYQMVLGAVIRQEKYHEFLQKIDDFLADLLPPAHRDWSKWRKERWVTKLRNTKPF
ncbi:hypothetical protein HYV22_02265 [Candidatus Gottesmanbacteria bacterium]|nr:hypothetical protein [Candidatus Gottesmanbacteria bacterium]